MHEFMNRGKVTPVIDKRYRLNEVSEAIRYLEEGQARGKVVITLQSVTTPDHVLHPTLRAGLRDFPVRKSEKSIESAALLFCHESGVTWNLQQVPVTFQRDANQLAPGSYFGLGEELLQGVLDAAF